MNLPNVAFVIRIINKYAKCILFALSIKTILVSLCTPFIMISIGSFVDSVSNYFKSNSSINTVVMWGFVLTITLIVAASSDTLNNLLIIKMKRKLNSNFSLEILKKFNKIEYSYFEDDYTNDIISKVSDSYQNTIVNALNNTLSILSGVISVFGIIIIFLRVSVTLTLIYLIIISLMVFLNYKSMSIMNNMFEGQTKDERRLDYYSSLFENKLYLQELKMFNSEEYINTKWEKTYKRVVGERVSTTIKTQKYYALTCLLTILWISLLMYILTIKARSESITIGMFASLMSSALNMIAITDNISYSISNIVRNDYLVGYIRKFLNYPERTILSDNNIFKQNDFKIEFINVSFAYQNTNKYVLNGLTFTVNMGEVLAIVGENGSGKSTIIKLICGLYKPTSGVIKINGVDINKISENQRKQIISVVFQDFCKYYLSVKENIAFGNINDISNIEKIDYYYKNLKINTFSDNLNENLGNIKEDAKNYSEGQWQQLALARMFFSNSIIQILDEPTSFLDPIAESDFYHWIYNNLQNHITVIITHRLSGVTNADKIILIKDGRVLESGTHNSLLAQNGEYKKMWLAQSSIYDIGEYDEKNI